MYVYYNLMMMYVN